MLLVTFSDGTSDRQRLGVLRDGAVLPVGPDGPSDLLALIAAGPAALAGLEAHLGEAVALDAVRLHAPFRPGKIIGVGLNYVEHVEESSRTLDTAKELPDRPVLFGKPATAVVGPGEPIRHDGNLTQQLDWECELAVVIGRRATRVRREDALSYVFGYSVMNDISARDQRRGGQWFFSKGQDSYAPFGPAVRTADEVPDPQSLTLGLKVNGEVKQKGSTAHMLFPVAHLIADITSGMTLEPGDVISTGSPQGVGAAQNPPQYLRPGDVVEATVEGIGTLRNPVMDAR
jgi:2-keto-4-pentenoate hydratase/2-oxohepta-3-ene-1,7-dioic acid hydratase in catechol pathway